MYVFNADIYKTYASGDFYNKILVESGVYCIGESTYENSSLYIATTTRTDGLNHDLFVLDDGTHPNIISRLQELYNSDTLIRDFFIINNISNFYIRCDTTLSYIVDEDNTYLARLYPGAFIISEQYTPNALVIYAINNVEIVYMGRVYTRPAAPDLYSIYSYGYGAASTADYNNADYIEYLLQFVTDSKYNPGPEPGDDPYGPGGETEEGGGTGTFDNTSEPIPVPDLPTTSAVETGFISLYKPSLAQLRALATYLWSANGLDLNTFKRIFSDPISAILGLSLVPIDPGLGNDVPVVLGNINTGVTMSRISQQYQKFNCGTLAIQEYWGGYLDYSPYTRAEIYLPFIGVKPLNIDDIMGKTISLWYVVDFLSGGCVACLECGGSVLYQFIGQCACSIPITGNDMTNVINGILSVVGAGVGAMVATGGVGLAGLAATGSLASNVMGMKTHVEKSGSMGGMGGMLGVKTPYIILTRPRQALPAQQNKFTGYPSFITTTLGACEGYTVVHEIHLEGLSATDDEKREIDQLLKGGVIL